MKVYVQKTLMQQYYLSTSPRPLTPYKEGRWSKYHSPMVTSIVMLSKNMKVEVGPPDGDTDNFDIVAGVLQGDSLAPYLFIISLDYMLRTFIDIMKDNGFKLAKEKQKIPHTNNYVCGICRWHSTSGKYTRSSWNPAT